MLEFLREQVGISEQLWAGKDTMLEPQDLPGRYGRVVSSLDRVLGTLNCPAVLAGGWAVWRHGYFGRMTQDLDIVLPNDRIQEFLAVSAVSGFQVLSPTPGRWPKVVHKETGIQVDILPEGERPGTTTKPAPTTIPAPTGIGASGAALRYVGLMPLVELKLAAGRGRDEADVIELIRVNKGRVDDIRRHLETVHPDYVQKFDELLARALEEDAP
ncbi:MAG: hypothetical protein O3C40_34255 [Planctomycetota bacterium]|nr:hypothetical protein [Planctomycetota bacterium]